MRADHPTPHRILHGVSLAAEIRRGVAEILEKVELPRAPTGDGVRSELERFRTLMSDYPNRPSKTLRGQLLVLSARAHGAEPGSVPHGAAFILAEALELFQHWVLIHDDIEDGSEERRGEAALHRTVGMPVALNVGDAMHMLMWRHLSTLPEHPTVRRAEALGEFTDMLLATATGQHLDLAWVATGRFDVSEADYLAMVTLKTAYYTVASPLRLGALCAGREAPREVREAALDLGVAFQIRDDVLNLAPGVGYGKEAAGDLYEGKRTLILARLLADLSEERRLRVIELLGKERAAKSSHEMEEVLGLMHETGAIRYAQEVAEERVARGLTMVESWLDSLPVPGPARQAGAILRGLAERSM